jgi:cysteine desulfurase / selenocysteine lyase
MLKHIKKMKANQILFQSFIFRKTLPFFFLCFFASGLFASQKTEECAYILHENLSQKTTTQSFAKIREDFPLLINNPQLIYFDNAASTQKPQHVIDAVTKIYEHSYANIGRGTYRLSLEAGKLYETAREKVARFINASPEETIFVSGTTEGINFIASTWGEENIHEGDEIVLSVLEHNANLLSWLTLARKKKAILKFIPVNSDGTLDLNNLDSIITTQTKLVSITQSSNAIGTQPPLEKIISRAHQEGALVLVDGAQSVPYGKVDVKKLGVDFFVFSGHKMLAPTGVGVLYIKKDIQHLISPYQFGGGMCVLERDDSVEYKTSVSKFEAGTPPFVQAIGLGAAIDYLTTIDFDLMQKHLASLCERAIEGLEKLPGVTIYGPKEELKNRGHLVSFSVRGLSAESVSDYLNRYGIAVRAGSHCAHKIACVLGYDSTVRVSFYLYNTLDEVDYFLSVIRKLVENHQNSKLDSLFDFPSKIKRSCRSLN